MEKLIEILEPLTPVIIIAGLAVFMTLETFMPYVQPSSYRKKQRWHNIGNVLVSFVLNASLSWIITMAIRTAESKGFGLLPALHISFWPAFVAGVLLCDLNSYVAHRLYHRIPLFWRFHKVHHSDTEMDATSALRMHPFEFIFQAFTQATLLPLLGVSFASFVLYFSFALPLFIVNHANLKYPSWGEKILNLIFITPNWHRVHHSSYQPQTDSNFGDVFTIWDRLFGTYQPVERGEEITYGLEDLREAKDQTLIAQLKTPFKSNS